MNEILRVLKTPGLGGLLMAALFGLVALLLFANNNWTEKLIMLVIVGLPVSLILGIVVFAVRHSNKSG